MILAEYFRKSPTQIQIVLCQMPYLATISIVNQALIRYYEGHTLQDSFPELTTTLQIPYNHINRRGRLPYIYLHLPTRVSLSVSKIDEGSKLKLV